jgi:putative zinc finger/helix-turn-helix YgiT family protein
MKCLNCDSTNFETRSMRFDTKYADETLEVVAPAHVCKRCEEPLMDNDQMNVLRQAAADRYRTTHGLLTSKQIVALRKTMEMSQREFSNYLGVGDASVKRWETYYAQEPAMDEHIRLKCDKNFAEKNALDVKMATQAKDVFSGNRDFSWEKFSNVVLALIETCKSPLYINKALFYVDFLHYRRFEASITGSTYAKLDYGPCPEDYRLLFKQMIATDLISETKSHKLVALQEPDMSLFDDSEIETIEHIIKITKKDSGYKLYNDSHEEDAYTKSSMYGPISYVFSKKLKIK